jgi:hypothetical protein
LRKREGICERANFRQNIREKPAFVKAVRWLYLMSFKAFTFDIRLISRYLGAQDDHDPVSVVF